ncbi:MAG TPA: 2-phospho-L-lactate transferase CofD family protein [Candidatus Woesebacteria bacterium]|nr:2-phospho-L-lactate transferase CofD family protein [Candidatus Woesebacteria bacterium]
MDRNTRLCTIGGGSGMPIINSSLVAAGFTKISSIVTTFDSGGDTGRMRTDERGRILAFSDYWRSLISLWMDGKQKEQWEEMLRFRDGRGRNFGNIFFQFLAERVGNLSHVDGLFSELTEAKVVGQVIPVSLEPADICFQTESKRIFKGEHNLDNLRMSLDKVVKVWLEPEVKANIEAVEAIRKAEVIIFCPGSMYGSVITNMLPKGMVEAYQKSRAKKILMTNIMSVANENNDFSQKDYVNVFGMYLNEKKPFDLIVMADITKLDGLMMRKAKVNYAFEHSKPIWIDKTYKDIETIMVDIAMIEEKNHRFRHSEQKLKSFFINL